MDIFDLALLIGCLLAALINRMEPRVLLWIGAGMADYVASSVYYSMGWPYHPFFTAMCDASVCLAVYFWARYRWEMGLYRAFQLSVLVSILKLSNWIDGDYAYALALELCNWAALLVLIGTGVAEAWGDAYVPNWITGGAVHRSMRAVRAERSTPPFHKTGR